jgi:hypothetical protein
MKGYEILEDMQKGKIFKCIKSTSKPRGPGEGYYYKSVSDLIEFSDDDKIYYMVSKTTSYLNHFMHSDFEEVIEYNLTFVKAMYEIICNTTKRAYNNFEPSKSYTINDGKLYYVSQLSINMGTYYIANIGEKEQNAKWRVV